MATTTTTTTTTQSSPSPFPNNWADTPFPLIPTPLGKTPLSEAHGSLYMAQGMAHLHNMILRGLNSIHQQAPYVSSPTDIADFLTFTNHWVTQLSHHHHVEETKFFPDLEALTGESMQPNVEQHRAFEKGLEELGSWAKSTTPSSYSSTTLRSIISSFGPTLRTHLADEIPTLLALSPYDSTALKKIWNAAGNHAKRTGEVSVAVPMMAGTYDVTYEGGAVSDVGLPWIVGVLNGWVFSRKYAGAWRFLPCDGYGRPRALAFGPKEEGKE